MYFFNYFTYMGGEGLIYFNRQLRIMICCVHVIYISLCCGGHFIDGGHTHGVCGGGIRGLVWTPLHWKPRRILVELWLLKYGISPMATKPCLTSTLATGLEKSVKTTALPQVMDKIHPIKFYQVHLTTNIICYTIYIGRY